MLTIKPRLIPLEVPWMVSPSTPFLELQSPQTNKSLSTYVQFVAYNKPHDTKASGATGRPVSVVDTVPEFQASRLSERGAYQLVRLHFVNAISARVSTSFSDSQVIEELAYDWSHVPSAWKGEDIFEHLRKADETWAKSGICGNPGVYEVITSDYAEEPLSSVATASKASTLKRFLILGHDSFVEINAEGVDVQYGQVLSGW